MSPCPHYTYRKKRKNRPTYFVRAMNVFRASAPKRAHRMKTCCYVELINIGMSGILMSMHKLVHITNIPRCLYEWVEVWATGQSPITPA
jgi:hypothetical protein